MQNRNFYNSLHRYGRDHAHLEAILDGRYVGSPKLLPIYENLYKDFIESTSQMQSTYLIPKKIHQIWLGEEILNKFSSCVQTWALAAGWEYRLWTDSDVDEILQYNTSLYQLGKNYGEKSDILRLEILYQEWGALCRCGC